ncbi:MAG: hypothetical protein HYY04_08080, partial [Chloroflexi bacterium]|nr:hypothetical protein [Chloroflexota bacterium]
MANDAVADIPFSQEIRTLFRTSLAVFLVTVIIGILNGLDIASFDRRTLLTHVHAGTLGWITLAVFGVVLWMLSEGRSTGEGSSTVRQLSLAAAVFITLHVLALFLFYPGASAALAVFGALALLVIVAFWVWVLGHSGGVWLSIPRLAALAAITTLTIGAVFGVLIELHLAGVTMPAGVFGAHPSGMVVGYLILMGMGIAEWRLRPAGPRTSPDWLGIAQVALPFIGGLTLMAGILLNVFALITLNVPFEVLGVLIFIGRLGPRVVR